MRPRIIIADDFADVRSQLTQILGDDYDVIASVDTGGGLVDAALALHPDALVIDVSMPGMNGFEALRRIRQLGLKAKAVMVSAHAAPAYVRRAMESGASGYVRKASSIEDLPQAMKAILNGETFVSSDLSPGIGA